MSYIDYDGSEGLLIQEALDPNTSEERLLQLMRVEATRCVVAKNPNLPMGSFRSLALAQACPEAWDSPLMLLLLMDADPEDYIEDAAINAYNAVIRDPSRISREGIELIVGKLVDWWKSCVSWTELRNFVLRMHFSCPEKSLTQSLFATQNSIQVSYNDRLSGEAEFANFAKRFFVRPEDFLWWPIQVPWTHPTPPLTKP